MVGHPGQDALKAAPPVAVSIASWGGITLQEWVYIITIIYTVLLMFRAMPKTYACVTCFVRHRSCDRKCKI
jgi:hypothetical protein